MFPIFKEYNCIPENFSGFWQHERHRFIGYVINGISENIFGATIFFIDGSVDILLGKNIIIDGKLINEHHIHKGKNSPEAQQAWMRFKLYTITNHL